MSIIILTSGGTYASTPGIVDISNSNMISNIGIIIAFTVGFCATYILATEYITERKSKGEVLLFRRGAAPENVAQKATDEESSPTSSKPNQKQASKAVSESMVKTQTAIFHWEDVCYDVKIKKEERRILDNVDGWVKPGTLTALMVSFEL